VLFFVSAMNLAGIPPMSGFLGKVGLVDAGLRVGSPLAYALVAASIVTSLLTLYAVAKSWNLAFWRTPEQAHEMALTLTEGDSDALGPNRQLRPHRDHVHAGPVTFSSADADDARRIGSVDQDDLDLHQLIQSGSLPSRMPRLMAAATAGLLAFSLALTLAAGPLYGYTERAARDVLERDAYIDSVLPERLR
jgi:multicomponent Na+:H+ antiporter subunit D